MTTPQPTGTARGAIAGLLASRKNILYLFTGALVLLMATGLEAAIVAAAIRGRVTLEVAITLSFGPMATGAIGLVALASKVIDGITREDEARIAADAPTKPQSIAAGGDVIVAGATDQKSGADAAAP